MKQEVQKHSLLVDPTCLGELADAVADDLHPEKIVPRPVLDVAAFGGNEKGTDHEPAEHDELEGVYARKLVLDDERERDTTNNDPDSDGEGNARVSSRANADRFLRDCPALNLRSPPSVGLEDLVDPLLQHEFGGFRDIIGIFAY